MQYWYTEQLRQYRLQFQRAFSDFYVQTGPDANGNTTLTQVPCRYGDETRLAATIITGNSENKVPPVPFMTFQVANLAMNAARRQDPNFVSKLQLTERAYDSETDTYLSTPGNRYTVERYMPIPYDLTIDLTIWSNNTQIKEQILEQILTLYNPSIEIQTSNNMLDWTSISLIELTDSNWSSRTIPIGTDNPIDISTLTFKLPIWINPPAKLKKQVIIQRIITNVIHGIKEDPDQWGWSDLHRYTKRITTPGDYHIGLCLDSDNYTVSLEKYQGTSYAETTVPTINITKPEPVFTTGDIFSYNGVNVAITNNSVEGVITSCQTAFAGTLYAVQQGENNTIRFINNYGNTSCFKDIKGIPVENMGFKPVPAYAPHGTLSWQVLFDSYAGILKPYSLYGVNGSQLRLVCDPEDTDSDIVGWIDLCPMNQNHLTWTIDQESMPSATLPNINAVIDPQCSGPGINLPFAAVGQRYLLLNSPSDESMAWGVFVDKNDCCTSQLPQPGDIIELTAQGWKISFDNSANTTIQYALNVYNSKLLVWEHGTWTEFIRRSYRQGQWRLSL